jgi:hypothetical protein
MKNLVGRSFAIADDRYRIVDVQLLGADALVYAESVDDAEDQRGTPARPRAAFHYGDIAPLLEAAPPA